MEANPYEPPSTPSPTPGEKPYRGLSALSLTAVTLLASVVAGVTAFLGVIFAWHFALPYRDYHLPQNITASLAAGASAMVTARWLFRLNRPHARKS